MFGDRDVKAWANLGRFLEANLKPFAQHRGLRWAGSSRAVWLGKGFAFKGKGKDHLSQTEAEINFLKKYGGHQDIIRATKTDGTETVYHIVFPRLLAYAQSSDREPWLISERLNGNPIDWDFSRPLAVEVERRYGLYDFGGDNARVMPDGRIAIVDCGVVGVRNR